MYGLTAFDSARASMEVSSYRLGMKDRETSVKIAAELVNFYEGNQRRYLEEHIELVFKDEKIQDLYKSLIFFANITALIVDRVTILGKKSADIQFLNEDGTPNKQDQKLWDHIADEELDNGGLDAFLAALGTYKELCKTVVALPFWDPRANRLCLRFYTPNVIDVAWDLRVGDPLVPTAYRILLNDQQSRYRVYDFSDPAHGITYEAFGQGDTGGAFQRIPTRDAAGNIIQDIELAAQDPKTGLTLDPFVPFRTTVPRYSYFVDDGQGQMVEGQRAINRTWTQLMAILHSGAFQVPILEGPAWKRQEGKKIELTLDPSQGIVVPSLPGELVSTIKWGGPANEGFIKAHLDTVAQLTETLVSTFHISVNDVVAKANPASGVSLFIGAHALKEKQERSAVLDRPFLRDLVYKTTIVWNAYSPIAKGRFSLKSRILVKIPTMPLSLDPLDELKHDALLVEEGFMLRDDIVRKYNPDANPEKLAQIKAQRELVGPPPINSLFRSSTIGGPLPPPAPGQPAQPKPGPPASIGQKSNPVPPPSARGGAVKPAGQKPGTNTGQ
jgi:hypothetical protein